MNFNELRDKLVDYGSSGYYMVESFLINLLKIHLEEQQKELIYNGKRATSAYDAFAPKGFDNFLNPTHIEITSSRLLKKLVDRIDRTHYFLSKGSDYDLLIIATNGVSDYSLSNATSYLGKLNLNIHIWGPEEIQRLIDLHSNKVKVLYDKIFTLRLESAINKKQDDWKEKRVELASAIKSKYQSGQFTLILGAGVSSSAGLPDWNTLLNSLFVSLLTSELEIDDSEISSIVNRLREVDEPSALMSARYIRKGLSQNGSHEQAEFIKEVTERLYSLRDKRKSFSSSLIKSIADLCAPGRTGAKVRSVITYNFDDLIERELDSRAIFYRCIFEETEVPTPEELPIYHVHGYLPEDRSIYSNLERSTLVFSEEGYHKIYNEPYHWSNIVQLNHLKETSCVMIGLSMTDPNLRRLLEISSRSVDFPKHFAFMKRLSDDDFSKEKDKKVVKAPLGTIKKFLDRHHSLNEEVLKELGVNIIWYESYDEIPVLLNGINKGVQL